jgi:RNA polymerase sigma-70 factor (ECF subfamily)
MTDPPTEFQARFEPLAPALEAWARLRCDGPLGRSLEAGDLFQEVALAAYAAFGRFDPARGPFRPWLFGVAARVAAEHLRRSARRAGRADAPLDGREERIPNELTTISRRVRRDEALARAVERLRGLEELDRRLLVHRGIEGLDHAEVATLTGLSGEAAAKRWQRLRERLRGWRELEALALEW